MNESLRYIVLLLLFAGSTLLASVAHAVTESKAQSGDVARGQILFARYCTGCHGPEGGGDGYRFARGPDAANLSSPSIKKKSDTVLLKTIHEGKPNMPPWNTRLSEKESKDVLAYVRSLAK
ncbi:MAG: Cytochrome c-554(547) [Nitrospira sp.]|nr:Cytochrome c-554(547) [Nitrospira sp.]